MRFNFVWRTVIGNEGVERDTSVVFNNMKFKIPVKCQNKYRKLEISYGSHWNSRGWSSDEECLKIMLQVPGLRDSYGVSVVRKEAESWHVQKKKQWRNLAHEPMERGQMCTSTISFFTDVCRVRWGPHICLLISSHEKIEFDNNCCGKVSHKNRLAQT